MNRLPRWTVALLALGAVLLVIGQALGLFWAPPEVHMRDVSRILYVHVPTAWSALVCYTLALAFALGVLFTTRPERWDPWVEGAVEVGVVLNALLLMQGSIWARATWETWWDWEEPRLTTSAILWLTFVGIAFLRVLVDDPDRRRTWSAVATVIAWVNAPITYMSVRWWRSLHQMQSTPDTISADMTGVLRLNAFAVLFLMIGFVATRAVIARNRATDESPPPPAPAIPPAAIGLLLLLLPLAASAAPQGTIEGRWGYVYGAYGVTWVVLGGYAASLVARLRGGRP